MRQLSAIILVTICSCRIVPDHFDSGFLVIDGREVHETTFPVPVACEPHIDCADAIAWWENELLMHWDASDNDGYQKDMPRIAYIVDVSDRLYVSEGYRPADIAGTTHLRWDMDGDIISADILMSEERWDRWSLFHEFGHALFGLAHDENSLDLNSIMASPSIPYSHVTEKDAWRIFKKMR